MQSAPPSGTLFIVATPIGNLGDITYRAVEVFTHVDLIIAEDTRHSRPLLDYYSVQTPLSAVHEHNERQRSDALVRRLQAGESIALISDAGTPLISDPGYPLVKACREAGVPVVPIPGASAVIAALSASGLPTDRFLFVGFLAPRTAARTAQLEALSEQPATLVFYESPRRVLDTLVDLANVFGPEREAVLAREVTKQFETFLSAPLGSLIEQVRNDANQQRGELVLMVRGAKLDPDALPAEATKLLAELTQQLPLKKAAAIVANHYGLRKNQLYQWGLDNTRE